MGCNKVAYAHHRTQYHVLSMIFQRALLFFLTKNTQRKCRFQYSEATAQQYARSCWQPRKLRISSRSCSIISQTAAACLMHGSHLGYFLQSCGQKAAGIGLMACNPLLRDLNLSLSELLHTIAAFEWVAREDIPFPPKTMSFKTARKALRP